MSKANVVWKNAPGWTISCKGCGCEFHPRTMHINQCESCVAAGEIRKNEIQPVTTKPLSYSRLRNVRGEHGGCQCEPCPFDLRSRGYLTCKEDPYFEGTQCLWHEQIRGSKGTIVVSGGTPEEPIFCAVLTDGRQHSFGLDKFRNFAKRIGAIKHD